MTLSLLDWLAIVGYLAITILLGFWFRKRSAKSVDDYFVSGRNVNWWLAGTSMVATTFAADTPLVVTGLVYAQGISGNWLWWGSLLSGMMTVFLFARLWRRSGLLTDVQFAEIRYSGKPAAFLRGFRAVYLGLLMNCVILGWVTKAMTSIVAVTLGGTPLLLTVGRWVAPLGGVWAGPDGAALAVCVLFLIPFTGLYVSLGGLWGVLWTDLFQFVLKMSIVIAIAFYAVRAVGGMSALITRLLVPMRASPATGNPLAFFPSLHAGLTTEMLWTIPVATFLVNIGMQWWAFWYPGAEPGGGGYIAQRIFSARDERQGLLSVLWFNVAHYAIRPWPWILTALSRHRPLPRPRPSRNRLHAGHEQLPCPTPCAASPSPDSSPPSCPPSPPSSTGEPPTSSPISTAASCTPGQQPPLRHGLAPRHRPAGHRLRLGLRPSGLHRQRLAGCHGSRRRNRSRLSPALVLVAHQRLVGDLRHGLLAGRHRHPQRAPSLPREPRPSSSPKPPSPPRLITTLVWLAVTLLTPAEPARNPRSLLPPRPPRRPRLATHRRPSIPEANRYVPPPATSAATSPPGSSAAPWSTSASSAPANSSSTTPR